MSQNAIQPGRDQRMVRGPSTLHNVVERSACLSNRRDPQREACRRQHRAYGDPARRHQWEPTSGLCYPKQGRIPLQIREKHSFY